MNHQFLGIVGGFLVVSGAVLYLLRNKLARAGVDGWAWLPENARFKTYERQLVWSKIAATVVAAAGLVFLVLFMLRS